MRKSRKELIRKKKLSEECWNLDHSFLKWLNQHLKVYLKEADKVVSLEYHKFTYDNQEYTQKQIIKMLIEKSDRALISDTWDEEYISLCSEILDLWKIVFHAMWW